MPNHKGAHHKYKESAVGRLCNRGDNLQNSRNGGKLKQNNFRFQQASSTFNSSTPASFQRHSKAASREIQALKHSEKTLHQSREEKQANSSKEGPNNFLKFWETVAGATNSYLFDKTKAYLHNILFY